jgi:hypothetical protein
MTIYALNKKIIKFTKSVHYKREFGEIEFPSWAIPEFNRFQQKYGSAGNPTEYMIRWIKFGLKNWAGRWRRIKLARTQSEIWYFLMWGGEEGRRLYKNINEKKTRGFTHDPEHQRAAGRKGAEGKKGKPGSTPRSVEWWVNKGHSLEYATEQVRKIQSTNTISKYVGKYGDAGEQKFNDRKEKWVSQINTEEISRTRSGGLWRYIERYGEEEGLLKYKEVRIKRNSSSRIGSASKESLVFFEPIIKILNYSKILFYCGINGNREWYIKDGGDFFLYDLSIPSLSLIIEYHGEGFHPNPDWDTVRWSQWRQAFSKKTADECRSYDIKKNKSPKRTDGQ